MKAFLKKHHELVLYGICGVPTIAANFVTYFVMAAFHISTVMCALAATLASVAVAYMTNKVWVFHTKRNKKRDAFKEFVSFLTCRLLTGFMEVVLLVVCVDMLKLEAYETFIKLCVTIFVIALNYFASKKLIFKDNNQAAEV